ncbi:MAG: SpoIIE family protein phosphatase [Rhodospirillales bacterium]|nr:SpoIIE family protein phosphatase [Rhodospirillales bacterium]
MPKALVIDDDPATRPMFEESLKAAGGGSDFEFVFAKTETEALDALRAGDGLDIAIVAVDSGVIGGMALFQKLAAEDARLPRIALSGKPDLDQIRMALKDGASDFLVKPVAKDELAATLDRVYRVCERRRLSWKNETELSAIRREIEIAGEIQKRILPSRFPVTPGLDIFARTLPAHDMGGDFYDVFRLPDGGLGLVIADVSGKGVPAAFYMAVAHTLIQATARHAAAPGDCMRQVNQLLCRHDVQGMFVSVFYGVLDTKKWKLTFANAGHPPPLLMSPLGAGLDESQTEGLVIPLDGGAGTLLGIDEDQTYEEGFVDLDPGEGVYFYTDGLTEAFDSERNAFGEERLWGCLSMTASGSASDLAGAVTKAIADFVGDADQHDDITSLVIKRV